METNGITCSRRQFIGKCLGIGALIAGGVIVIDGCGPGRSDKQPSSKNAAAGSCDDLSGISESEIAKRKKFGYVKESTIPGSHCGNCSLFIPGDPGNPCGGCLLFKGPVRATGYCTQYAAKT
jgi:hypothetical protein